MKCRLLIVFILFINVVFAQSARDENADKQKALTFLQNNMVGLFSLSSDNSSKFYKYMNAVFERTDTLTNDQYRDAYRYALHNYPFNPEDCDTLHDISNVALDYLKTNIDNAYAMWKRNSHQTSFDTFCNYVLPYRIGYEPISDWRQAYQETYWDVVSPYFSKQHNYFYIFSIHNVLNKDFNGAVYYPTGTMPEFSLTDLPKVKIGNCESYSARSVAQLRAFGIPATIDFVPQWGNRSMGHSWAVMFVNDNYTLPFGLNESLGSHFDERPDLTMPKVYRQTFKIQENLRDIFMDEDPNIPALFRSNRYIDVTDSYVETSSITLKVKKDKWSENARWLYLAVFNNQKWVPVAISAIGKDMDAVFHKVGRSVMYIAFFLDEFGREHYISDPFLLDKNGKMQYMNAETASGRTISVTRKYMESEVLRKYNRQLIGGKIVASNTEDFKDSVIIAVIDSIKENRYHTINVSYSGSYKYVKYLSPKKSFGNIAEIQFYDNNGSLVSPKRSFGGMGAWEEHSPAKVFDGNELTSYSRISPDDAWAAAEFDKSVHFSKIRIHPRTDGNAIYAGDVYQLLYWQNGKWNLVAEYQAGQEDRISFDNVPANALLLLHNASRGREERIFTYENGKQIWW